jgi:hypothetical protein
MSNGSISKKEKSDAWKRHKENEEEEEEEEVFIRECDRFWHLHVPFDDFMCILHPSHSV